MRDLIANFPIHLSSLVREPVLSDSRTGHNPLRSLAALIFWYLNQPHVKTAFGATQASVASA